jgi:hypothetical protein
MQALIEYCFLISGGVGTCLYLIAVLEKWSRKTAVGEQGLHIVSGRDTNVTGSGKTVRCKHCGALQ